MKKLDGALFFKIQVLAFIITFAITALLESPLAGLWVGVSIATSIAVLGLFTELKFRVVLGCVAFWLILCLSSAFGPSPVRSHRVIPVDLRREAPAGGPLSPIGP